MYFISTFLFFIITASPTKLRSSQAAETSQLPFNESPYWEYILREFVFKTISSLPQSNSILYKKLFEAPFYGGPLVTLSNEDNALLSSGDVYHLPDGQWILCQDGCQNCKLCLNQKDSLVKWTLKKVKRNITSSDLYGFDLLLTVVPKRGSTTFLNFGFENINIPYDIKSSTKSSNLELTVTEETHIDRTRFSRSWRRMQRDQIGQNDEFNKNINRTEELVSVDNSTIASSLNLKDDIKNSTDTSPTHQLILGTDQLGNKHVIHILSMNSSEKSDIYDDIDYQLINNAVKLSQSHLTIRKPPSPYRQYVKKVLDSIYSHRPIVEKFLSHNQLNQDKRPIILFPIYSELLANDTNDFK